ncbi:hypothetical protein JTE90_027678 [Oedothorax gibbosus]|uniref:Uncharacterized protein n=1 Tax=Oedothorax gibbosus TaxID=931172 RepID=A0AAV6TD23_9ARAC|nr:hypothetical protein JTE90_027678 [Oedothorax gibbosus]
MRKKSDRWFKSLFSFPIPSDAERGVLEFFVTPSRSMSPVKTAEVKFVSFGRSAEERGSKRHIPIRRGLGNGSGFLVWNEKLGPLCKKA